MDSKSVPKHVEFFTKIKLIYSASRWLLLQEYITMHGPLNVKFVYASTYSFYSKTRQYIKFSFPLNTAEREIEFYLLYT